MIFSWYSNCDGQFNHDNIYDLGSVIGSLKTAATVGVSEEARESLLEAFNREGWMMNAQVYTFI